MPRLTRSLAAVPLTVALAAAAVAAPASAAPKHRFDTLPLVTGSQPEGISAGPGTTFFAGSRRDGAVYVGDVRRGTEPEVLVEGRAGGFAVGLLHDAATGRLWVAGGPTGTVTAYDARTGAELFSVDTDPDAVPTNNRFLNDVAVTRDAVYVTDSTRREIVVVPLGRGAALPPDGTFEVLTLRGDYRQPSGFGLNGIRVLPGGDLLTVSGGALYVVDPATGVADRLELTAEEPFTGGDGLVLRGNRLYVVRPYDDRDSVVEVRLRLQKGTGEVVDEVRDADFDEPTTAALIAGDLYVVNGQFASPADEATEVVRIDRP